MEEEHALDELIVVTGASGKFGSLTIPRLRAAGAHVRAIVRNPEKASDLKNAGVEVVKADLDEPETLKPAFEGARRVLVISSLAPEMVDIQKNAVDAARNAGATLIVKISAIDADPQSEINTSRWHGQVEEYIRATKIPSVMLRSSGTMQNLLGMGRAVRQGSFKTCRTDGREAMVDARDVAEATVSILLGNENISRVLTLTGPESLTIDEVAARISDCVQKLFVPSRISEDEYHAMMLGYGLPEWMLNDMIAWGRMHQNVSDDLRAVLGRGATPLSRFLNDHSGALRD